jgi:hypothetical protein
MPLLLNKFNAKYDTIRMNREERIFSRDVNENSQNK